MPALSARSCTSDAQYAVMATTGMPLVAIFTAYLGCQREAVTAGQCDVRYDDIGHMASVCDQASSASSRLGDTETAALQELGIAVA